MRVILDGNIYNRLSENEKTRLALKSLVEEGRIIIIATRTVVEELLLSPFYGIPDFFSVEYTGNTVGRCGIMAAGDSIGRGETFDAHLGNSNKVNDALIVDTADLKADFLVSDDIKMRKRMAKVARRCIALSYEEFKAKIAKISNN